MPTMTDPDPELVAAIVRAQEAVQATLAPLEEALEFARALAGLEAGEA